MTKRISLILIFFFLVASANFCLLHLVPVASAMETPRTHEDKKAHDQHASSAGPETMDRNGQNVSADHSLDCCEKKTHFFEIKFTQAPQVVSFIIPEQIFQLEPQEANHISYLASLSPPPQSGAIKSIVKRE